MTTDDEKDIKIVDVNTDRVHFSYKLDTWGSPKNYDKLFANIVRLIGMFLLGYLLKYEVTGWKYFIFLPLGVAFIGVTKIEYFQNAREKFLISCW